MDLESFARLLTPDGQTALAEAGATLASGAGQIEAVTTLRRRFDADLVSAALTQAGLRRRAVPKFGPDAEVMYFTPHGLEQATRPEVAEHRARRLAGLSVADACCGIGGDLIAQARAGCTVDAVDLDPLTVAVATANVRALGVRAEVRVASAESLDPGAYDALFADPARRTTKGRVFDPAAYSPTWDVVLDLVRKARRACLKVAPGIPYEYIPDGMEAEWVSFRGEVKEAVLWSGAEGRRATLLPSGETMTARGVEAGVAPIGRYLYEPDGAAVRAHLVGEVAEIVGGRLIDPQIAYLSADEHVPTPWAAGYLVEEVMPFSLKRLRAALRERRVGAVTIKKRGSAVDVERLRHDLRLSGEGSMVVVLTRLGTRPVAVLASEMGR
ncbi:class I SAM-dependent methyltransferase [Herbidospora sp. NBRC 101105]|uniref:class I SAM-dependent methyltransferase n=1 Tax=Herbidospora sp. NBRC 101105 TaxID=3032195 RepID=UPI0024A16E5B|nr:class I SAM-dependent methyltransferase [Herbidospora sp. NBRC 101105]GLX95674.1 methyltransferase [Herbidospora sp. NBRC 101105]